MNEEIVIRKAVEADAEGVFSLINYWYDNYFTGDKSKGHLYSDVQWNIDEIKRLIAESNITVADDKNKIVSFYFINKFKEIGNVEQRIKILQRMILDKKLPIGKYAFSLGAATDDNYLGKGLNKKCLNYLKNLASTQYDFFVGVMDYENIATHKSSLKMGWKHFGDIGIGLLAITGTTDERNNVLDEYLAKNNLNK